MKIKSIIFAAIIAAVGVFIWSFYYLSHKQQAYRFLKENIENYGWVDNYLTNSRGDTVEFSPFNYKTLYATRDTLDSIRKLFRSNAVHYPDAELISNDSLKIIIKNAINQWQSSPFATNLSFEEFCEYLLPYRAGAERLCDFTDIVRTKYTQVLIDSNTKNPIAAACIINDDMKAWIKFDLRSHALLSEPSALELMRDSLGSCRTMAELFVQIMRTMGIPSAIDECPVWAHRNSGHEWTAVRDIDGAWKPFEPAEFNPDGFRAVSENTKTPKIYRRTFSFNNEFSPQISPSDIPSTFRYTNRVDVTHEYVTTSNISIAPEINHDKSNGILYLAVFNTNHWIPVAWSKIENGIANFKNVGNNDIIYLPVFYRNGNVIPSGTPFILSRDSERVAIVPDRNNLKMLDMKFQNRYWTVEWDTFSMGRVGRVAELYSWDEDWKLCDRDTVNETFISHFENVPSNGLYLIRWQEIANTWQRPFMADSTSDNSRWF